VLLGNDVDVNGERAEGVGQLPIRQSDRSRFVEDAGGSRGVHARQRDDRVGQRGLLRVDDEEVLAARGIPPAGLERRGTVALTVVD